MFRKADRERLERVVGDIDELMRIWNINAKAINENSHGMKARLDAIQRTLEGTLTNMQARLTEISLQTGLIWRPAKRKKGKKG